MNQADAPWLAQYDPGMPHHIEPEFDNALAMFKAAAKNFPTRPCLLYFDRTITMGEVDAATDALAAWCSPRRASSMGGQARRLVTVTRAGRAPTSPIAVGS